MLNLQTERIDNHKAQLTVEIEPKQFDDAKRKAARKISRRVNIKGFRKGKAPYRLVAQYVGEVAIIEEAVELLGSDVYRQALEESDIEPYGSGSLEDFKLEPVPTLTFSVSLQPEVDLKDFADIRLDFEAPVVTDKEVNEALEKMRLQAAEVLDDELELAAAGNRVTIDVHSEFSDGEEADDNDEADDEGYNDDDGNDMPAPRKGDDFLHRHDWTLILDPEKDSIIEGFAEALVGAQLDADVEFELTIPQDDKYESLAGRKVMFDVAIKKIESIRIPALDDEFARKMGEDRGDDIHDMDALRQSEREELEQAAFQDARVEYSKRVLEKIIEGADIAFPAEMEEEHIDGLMDELDRDLQQQGINLEKFIHITGTPIETLREQYRERATRGLRQNLAMRELAAVQDAKVSDEQVEEALDEFIKQFGGGDQFRNLFDTPKMRETLAGRLFIDQMTTRLCAIGRGEDIEKALEERKAQVKSEDEKMRQRTERIGAGLEEEDEAAAEAETDDGPDSGAATETAGRDNSEGREIEAETSKDV